MRGENEGDAEKDDEPLGVNEDVYFAVTPAGSNIDEELALVCGGTPRSPCTPKDLPKPGTDLAGKPEGSEPLDSPGKLEKEIAAVEHFASIKPLNL